MSGAWDLDLGDGLRTARLRREHADEHLALVERDRAALSRWLGWAGMATPGDARDFLARGERREAEDGLPWIGLWLDGRLVGGVLWMPVERPVMATSVGYWLDSAVGGRGLMTRSLQALIDVALDARSLRRLGLEAAVGNTASRRVAERLGFTFEGVKRSAGMVGDRVDDHAVYSLLVTDPRPWHAAVPRPGVE
jgi:ribosomal-protein-serine acetyltransferase